MFVDWRVRRVTVSLNRRQVCAAAKIVLDALELYASWTQTTVDDRAAAIARRVWDWGCGPVG